MLTTRNGYRSGAAVLSGLVLVSALAALHRSQRPRAPREISAQRRVDYAQLPLAFEANRGQAAGGVQFLARGQGYTLFLTPTEAVLGLRRSQHPGGTGRAAALRMQMVGGNPRAEARGSEKLPGVVNYFLGSDPAQWRTRIPTYARVLYAGVYPGVDLVYYGKQRELEYDFVVAPGRDPGVVRLRFQGAERLSLAPNGDLVLGTPGGELRQLKPVTYQESGGRRTPVESGYTLLARNEVGFRIGAYDPTRPLIIDPVLSYATFLGGAAAEEGRGIAIDGDRNAYLTGSTLSARFPTGLTYGGGSDAFITKISPKGDNFEYSTYLGGSGNDQGYAIAVDPAGSAYVAGETASTNFPKQGALQANPGGGGSDAFVAKLSPNGSALVYSTYLGGNGGDAGLGVALDTAANAYVAGVTTSGNMGSIRPYAGGTEAFAAKVKADGSGLLYYTYLGGTGADRANAIAVESGFAYLTGATESSDFPTLSPFTVLQASRRGGSEAFVTKLGGAGAVEYSTYLGGTGDDRGYGIAVASGKAFVTGVTASNDFPTRFPWRRRTSTDEDAFVTKLDQFGSDLGYSTYIGGSGADAGHGIALFVDSRTKDAYVSVTGRTASADFFVTDTSQRGGGTDAFISRLNATGDDLNYSTFLGGSGEDQGNGIAVDRNIGAIHVVGQTASADFPATRALQPALGGDSDAFVARYALSPPTELVALPFTAGTSTGTQLTWKDNSDEEDGYEIWRRLDGGQYEPLARTLANATSYVDNNNVAPNTTYQVRATAGPDRSDWSNEARVTRPAAPQLTSAAAVDSHSVNLAWTDSTSRELARPIAYQIWRRKSGETAFLQSGLQTAPGLTFQDNVADTNEIYTYRLRSVFAGGDTSEWSNTINVTAIAGPTELAVVATDTATTRLTWKDNSASLETGFKVERAPAPPPDQAPAFAEVATLGPNATSYTNTGLSGDAAYLYRVRAVAGANSASDYSNQSQIPTVKGPSGLTASGVSTSQVNLGWTDNSVTESGFKIERRVQGGTWAQVHTRGNNSYVDPNTGLVVNPTGPIGFTDTLSVAPETVYEYRVRAHIGATSDSDYSNVVTTLTRPPAPLGLVAVLVGTSQADLTWVDTSARETGFKIVRTGGGAAKTFTVGPDVTTFRDMGPLTDITVYTYQVFATNSSGDSAGSNLASVRTPGDPTGLTATAVSPTQINLQWVDNSASEVRFEVERKEGTGSYAVIAELPANSTSLGDPTATVGVLYTYRVRAFNPHNPSLYTNEATCTVSNLGAPTGLAATPVTSRRIDLTWNGNSTGATGFTIERAQQTYAANGTPHPLAFTALATVSPTTTRYGDLTVPDPQATYTYRIRAFNAATASGWNVSNGVIPLPGPTNLRAAPVAIMGPLGTAPTPGVQLDWTDNSTTESGFEIERKNGPLGTYTVIGSVGPNTRSFTHPSYSPEYIYRVKAKGVGNDRSVPSNEAIPGQP